MEPCDHKEKVRRFVGYCFTEELFAFFCKKCGKQIDEPKT